MGLVIVEAGFRLEEQGRWKPPTPGFIIIAQDESSLQTSKEEQDENHYQDRPQKTTRGIAPTLAMRPGRKGADEKEDEYDN
jgi:hypothetical protein